MGDDINYPVITIEGRRTCIPIGISNMSHNASISQLGEASDTYTAPMYAMHVALKNLQCHLQKSEDKVKQLTRRNAELADENFQLKKEKHKFEKQLAEARKVNQELQEKLLGMSGLMRKLSQVTVENQNLEMRVLALTEEVDNLQAKLARTAAAFHTYPWSDVYASCGSQFSSSYRAGKRLGVRRAPLEGSEGENNEGSHSLENKSGFSESWEEISQKLLLRLKEEMKELQELDSKLAQEVSASSDMESHCSDTSVDRDSTPKPNRSTGDKYDDDSDPEIAMHSINALRSNMGSIKTVLLKQQQTLRMLVSNLATASLASSIPMPQGGKEVSRCRDDISVPFSIQEAKELLHRLAQGKPKQHIDETNLQTPLKQSARTKSEPNQEDARNHVDGRARLLRPSDETVRQYFTQQLTKTAQLMHHLHVKTPEDGEGPEDLGAVIRNLEAYARQDDRKYNPGCVLPPELQTHRNAQVHNYGSHKGIINGGRNDGKSPFTSPKLDDVTIHCSEGYVGSQKVSPADEESVCPMCQAVFPKQIPQEEFEAHVIGHFELDTTILDQYELV